MVSFKSLAILTLSATTVAAIPRYNHQRFHRRAVGTGDDFIHPTGHVHTHEPQNDTENGPLDAPFNHNVQANLANVEASPCLSTETAYVTSVNVHTVTAARRWEHTRSWGGYPGQWTPVASPAASEYSVPAGADSSVAGDVGSTATPAATSTSTPVADTSSGGRKGLSYNSNSLLSQFSGAGASWVYNWASSAGGSIPSGVEYVPMCWGQKSLGDWASSVASAIASGSKHVLSFNEPDHPEQSNMDPATAAQLHKANLMPLRSKGVQVISPAVTNSVNAGQGLNWMTSFLAACGANNGCGLDGLAIHWYNEPGTFQDFQNHIDAAIALANTNGIPGVWLTEFAVTGSTDQQAAFLQQALPYLDSKAGVARYAYFMVGDGQLTTGGVPNAAGKAYIA